MEQDITKKLEEQLNKITSLVEKLDTINKNQNREIKVLKKRYERTSSQINSLKAMTCIAVLFFYFHNTTTIDADKKQLIENIVLTIASGAGLNSALRLKESSDDDDDDEE